eukprot:TRINITY_DN32355_c0_g1_i1.p1 TRINITY_DN32355_c0_g1~~TRINITY_DN32355_c0_g1_i1.p1  ORF type:complete len:305 (+),score=95.39 TRINITY_DN32355_c0_g1_i1:68-982(+)
MAAPRSAWLFEFAPPAYTVRATEKDTFYRREITEQVTDTVTRVFGTRTTNRFDQEVRLMAAGLYFFLTMGSNRQTLGEEYCDVLQVHESRMQPLTKLARTVQALLHIGTPYLLERWLPVLLLWLRNRADQFPPLVQSAILKAHKKQMQLKALIHRLLQIHLAFFFIWGRYYQVSDRLTGGRLLLMNKSRPSMNYAILGWLILIQQAVETIKWFRKPAESEADVGADDDEDDDEEELKAEVGSCTLCLGARDGRRGPTTATVCGHLYCWDCITGLCRSSQNPQCPLCRERISLQTLAPIYRYKPA